MPVGRLLATLAMFIAVAAFVVTVVALIHTFATAHDPHMLMHELEAWVVSVGFHLALILLATSGIYYLGSKK